MGMDYVKRGREVSYKDAGRSIVIHLRAIAGCARQDEIAVTDPTSRAR